MKGETMAAIMQDKSVSPSLFIAAAREYWETNLKCRTINGDQLLALKPEDFDDKGNIKPGVTW